MIHSSLLANTALRTPKARLPRVFCRHKSITAAIERGRQHTSRDQRFGSKTTSFPSTRREAPAGSRGGHISRPEPEQRERRPWRADKFSTPNERNFAPHRAFDNSTRRREDTGWDYDGRGESGRREDSFRDRRTERREERGFRPGPREDTLQGRRVERSDEKSFRSGPKDDAVQGETSGRGGNISSQFKQSQYLTRDRRTRQGEERGFQNTSEDDAFQDRRPRQSSNMDFQSEQTQDVSRDKRMRPRQERSRQWRNGKRDEKPSLPFGLSENASQPSRVVEALPYTTAASEFLYGHSSVLAALKAHRRQLFNLYIHDRGLNHQGKDAIVQHARALPFKVSIREVGDGYLRAMDKATGGRPHNGFILETSPLPVPPITELGASSVKSGTFEVALDKQTQEDIAVNGKQTLYTYKSAGWRNPLVLYIDGVLDEGNLGAIARSAYFLGVDAIATATRQTAPWSHVTLKASAGAAEAIPIFQVNQGTEFLGKSARAGWRIYASAALPPAEERAYSVSATSEPSFADFASSVIYTYAKSPKRLSAEHCPVENHPTILMMGSEGEGLRNSLLNMAHFKVGIRHGREVDEVGVDSLNVSVAASLLCYHMLQKPRPKRNAGELMF